MQGQSPELCWTGITLSQPVTGHLQTDDSALGDSGREEEQVAPCSR